MMWSSTSKLYILSMPNPSSNLSSTKSTAGAVSETSNFPQTSPQQLPSHACTNREKVPRPRPASSLTAAPPE